ncbi:MAG: sigma-54-dependent Fis family transcriptional regulator [Desulfobacterales bacterium]|nr:sigma-54-dependent Fis family transcriptional regulator [Desulfobacterales bacterium]
MAAKIRLNTEEREFFTLVTRASLTNPFSDEREALDLKISGLFPGVSYEKRLEKTLKRVKDFFRTFENEGRADITRYSDEDRVLVEYSFIFDFFHQFLNDFDDFIQNQIQAGSAPIEAPFTRDAFALLKKRGFRNKEALRYFELSFQLRRAYFFINRGLVGRSACMRELRESLWNNVFTHNIELYNRYLWNRMEDFSTLMLGETGVGKGAAARAIGQSGYIPFDEKKECFKESFTRSFVDLNLSQFPETLIESELFGHKKGAFTGAVEDYKGAFDRCSRFGAILLDEIGEVSTPVQIKLLRVLQDRYFTPVGSHEKRRFNGRVIAATNRPIRKIREGKVLRDDFFYRLSSDVITVPPLRQRIREDPGELDDLLALLVERMLGKPSPEISEMVKRVIDKQLGDRYPWPGNVRELEQCIRRVILNQGYTGDYKPGAADLRAWLAGGIDRGDLDARRLLTGYCALLHRQLRTYEETARVTGMDRRTVKKYILEWEKISGDEGMRNAECGIRNPRIEGDNR